jgi:hypothetical protein
MMRSLGCHSLASARPMRTTLVCAAILSAMIFVPCADAQQPDTTSGRDVLLEVPRLALDSVGLDVTSLRAHLSLDANVVNVVQLTAGLDLAATKVRLDMSGVFVESYFYTKLDNTTKIADRVMRSLNLNPALFGQVMGTTTVTASRDTTAPPRRP